jgi:L-alanine-DL-glutamate epimerase-like enolase superfamily enzyme
MLQSLAPRLVELRVDLLEQPVSIRDGERLRELDCPLPICADEPVNTIEDLPNVVGRYDFINIKLEKSGGLTAALDLAHAAREAGLRLMVGCMMGSSLAMAPGMLLAQLCEVADLDGPLLQDEDWPNPIVYREGIMSPPLPALWG